MRRFRTYPQIGGKRGGIPSGWVEVEYLESTGTQYIDTGVTASNGLTVDMDYDRSASASASVLALYHGGDGYLSNALGAVGFQDYIYLTRGNNGSSSAVASRMSRHTIKVSDTEIFVDGVLKTSFSRISITPSRSIYLLAANEGGVATRFSSAKVYSFSIDGKINLVPVRNATTNEGAMCDVLTGTIHRNAGTGSFVVGPDVKHAKDYVKSGLINQIDGIENAGYGAHDSTSYMDCLGFIR